VTTIQKFFQKILPKKWADEMRAESENWKIRCESCGTSRSVWEAGGIRWRAASVGKKIKVFCPQCRTLRTAAVEFRPAAP
jgi:ribosomal protein L44E